MLRSFGHPVATRCDMLGFVGSNLKMVKFFMQHLWMLHDVVIWPGSCNNVAPNNVAIVSPELAIAGPTMLGCVALRCCYRLAGASR